MIPFYIKMLAVLGLATVEVKQEPTTKSVDKSAMGHTPRSKHTRSIFEDVPIGKLLFGVIFLLPLLMIFYPTSDNSTDTENEEVMSTLPALPEKYQHLEPMSFDQLMALDIDQKHRDNLQGWKNSIDIAECDILAKMHRDNINSYILSYTMYVEQQKNCS